MIEMRDALIRNAVDVNRDDGGNAGRLVLQAAGIIDLRLRCSDIELTFGHCEDKLYALFAQYQAHPQQDAGEHFGWHRLFRNHPFIAHEQNFLNSSLTRVVGDGRVDVAEWLIDTWGAWYNSRCGETLTDIAVISPWAWYHIDKIFDTPHDTDNEINGGDDHISLMVLRLWHDCEVAPRYWNSETTIPQNEQIYPLRCDGAALSALLKAALAYLSRDCNYHWQDKKRIKKMLTLAEPPVGHPQTLNYLADNNLGLPCLAVLACRGATWALDWLLEREWFTLETMTSNFPEHMRLQLHDALPWLTKAAEERLPIGTVLAAACASHGAVAMLEKISQGGTHYLRARLHRGRTVLHLAARARQRVTVIWLVENGYDDLLRMRSRGRITTLDRPFCHWVTCTDRACVRRCSQATPLQDAVVGGDPEVVRYLVKRGGADGEPVAKGGGPLWEEIALASQHGVVREVAMERQGGRILDVTVLGLLRSGAAMDNIREQMTIEGVRDEFSRNMPRIRMLLQAAMVGKRGDFLRFLYDSSGGEPPYIGSNGISEVVDMDDNGKLVYHVDICREFVGASGTYMSQINALINELKSKSTYAHDCFMELHNLTEQLDALITAGSTVEEIVAVVTQIGALLQEDDQTIIVYGMRLKSIEFTNDKPVLEFNVENIGSFEIFTACAMHGHLHLLRWLLEGKYPPSIIQVGNALATCLDWGGQTQSLELLCRHLEAHSVDLDTVRRTGKEHPHVSKQVGVLEYALNGLLTTNKYCKQPAERMKTAWDNARWLATHTQAHLRANSFPDLLTNSALSTQFLRDEEYATNQQFVLELTRFCVETLGASWSEVASEIESGGRTEKGGRTALQLLLNGYWVEAVAWLAKEQGAPLQGLVIEQERYFGQEERFQIYHDRLQQLHEEERAAWVCLGVP